MATVVGIVSHQVFGLQYVLQNMNRGISIYEVDRNGMLAMRTPPTQAQLERCNRGTLIDLAVRGGMLQVQRATKVVLARFVEDNWRNITIEMTPSHFGVRLCNVFSDAFVNAVVGVGPPPDPPLNHYDDSDDGSSSTADSMLQQILEGDAYDGQPHRQPDLPSGWRTPDSVGTSEVLGEKVGSEFVPDTASEYEEVKDNVMDNKKIQDKLKEYATMTRSCSHDEVKVDVKVGETTFPFFYKKDTSGHDFADFLDFRTDGKLNRENVLLSLNGSFPPLYENLMSYLNPNDVLVVVPRVSGGGRHAVQKTFMKKADAVKALKKKVQTIYETDEDNNIPEASLPASFNVFIQEQETALNEFLMMKTRAGYSFFALAIKHLQGDELMTLKNILNPPRALAGKAKNLTSEEKLSKSIHALFPALVKMKLCQTKLEHQQEKMMKTLMEAFVETYHTYNEGAGTINIDLQTLTNTVEGELTQRNINVPPPSEEGNGCIIQ